MIGVLISLHRPPGGLQGVEKQDPDLGGQEPIDADGTVQGGGRMQMVVRLPVVIIRINCCRIQPVTQLREFAVEPGRISMHRQTHDSFLRVEEYVP